MLPVNLRHTKYSRASSFSPSLSLWGRGWEPILVIIYWGLPNTSQKQMSDIYYELGSLVHAVWHKEKSLESWLTWNSIKRTAETWYMPQVPQDFLDERNLWGLVYSGEKDIIKEAGPVCRDDKTTRLKTHHFLCGNEDTGLVRVTCSFWMPMGLACRQWDHAGRRKLWKLCDVACRALTRKWLQAPERKRAMRYESYEKKLESQVSGCKVNKKKKDS